MTFLNLCVLFGGVSSEHGVSLISAANILANLNRDRYNVFPVVIDRAGDWFYLPHATADQIRADKWAESEGVTKVTVSVCRSCPSLIALDGSFEPIPLDCMFPVMHGKNGEDGTIQGLFEIMGVPYVGCGVLASAAGMDKTMTKQVVDHLPVRQAAWTYFTDREISADVDACVAKAEAAFGYPMFVKPSSAGSSFGTNKAKDRAGLISALGEAAAHDSKVLVEEFISGQEVEVAVLGNHDLLVSGCGEILPTQEFYTYDAKYNDETSQTLLCARLTEEEAARVQNAADQIYRALGARGLSRVDFFVTHDTRDVVFNEINTLPGFTGISMYPKLIEAAGVSTPDLLDRLIELAMQ
ncbi:MAG: D-alanine--D-alanine ligase [Ruminococcaceae bacterium]|nr:D-alanine--D-alanine ligase [Oscillospiraceae bacterium]